MADDEPSVMVDLIAGWASGAVAVICVQPIDTWLTRHQALATGLPKTSGLWRGSLPMIWSVPLQNALLMGGYGVGQKFFTGEDGSARQTAAIFVGGCTGGQSTIHYFFLLLNASTLQEFFNRSSCPQ